MERSFIVQSSNLYEIPPHSLTIWYEGTQHTIRIPLDTLAGSNFHKKFAGLVDQWHNNMSDDGQLKQSPFEISKNLHELIWGKCRSIVETHPKTDVPARYSLQDLIQPPTVYLTFVKSAASDKDVIVRVEEASTGSREWVTSRLADRNTENVNIYGWGTAPCPMKDLPTSITTQNFKARELFVAKTANLTSPYQQVHASTGEKFFFKPRLDIMEPEFNREVSILDTITSLKLHNTLRISPFRGFVVLENGLAAGMLFDWLESSPLAIRTKLGDETLHRKWQDQVGATVNTLHEHNIIWGDVNVHNILIDANDDAWVIDFGGNCNVEFVGEELKETYEGDKQGLQRVFEEWLPAKVKAEK